MTRKLVLAATLPLLALGACHRGDDGRRDTTVATKSTARVQTVTKAAKPKAISQFQLQAAPGESREQLNRRALFELRSRAMRGHGPRNGPFGSKPAARK